MVNKSIIFAIFACLPPKAENPGQEREVTLQNRF